MVKENSVDNSLSNDRSKEKVDEFDNEYSLDSEKSKREKENFNENSQSIDLSKDDEKGIKSHKIYNFSDDEEIDRSSDKLIDRTKNGDSKVLEKNGIDNELNTKNDGGNEI